MKILTSCGLVRAKRQGGYTIYSIDGDRLKYVIALLNELLDGMEVR
jgi:DNA-binding transcriptional ArsR family regulator